MNNIVAWSLGSRAKESWALESGDHESRALECRDHESWARSHGAWNLRRTNPGPWDLGPWNPGPTNIWPWTLEPKSPGPWSLGPRSLVPWSPGPRSPGARPPLLGCDRGGGNCKRVRRDNAKAIWLKRQVWNVPLLHASTQQLPLKTCKNARGKPCSSSRPVLLPFAIRSHPFQCALCSSFTIYSCFPLRFPGPLGPSESYSPSIPPSLRPVTSLGSPFSCLRPSKIISSRAPHHSPPLPSISPFVRP